MKTDLTLDMFDQPRLALFWKFICERQTIWTKRVLQHLPPPWTDDPVLSVERFTNIYRELDPGTRYVLTAILEVDAPKTDKIFNTMLYRLIGRAETHARIGFQHVETFSPAYLMETLRYIRDVEKLPPFTAAYMVSGYTSMGTRDKAENIARLFGKLQLAFPQFYQHLTASPSSEAAYAVIRAIQGFGNFLAYQVLVDLLYPLQCYTHSAILPFSHNDWASAGPGAQRGIKMLLHEATPPVSDLAVMRWLHTHQHEEFTRCGLKFPYLVDGASGNAIAISLANIQNCLCEFHKYVKIGNGTGKGRRKFSSRSAAPVQQLTLGEGAWQ